MTTLDLKGFDAVISALANGERLAIVEIERAQADVLDEARDLASQYPPELPGQVYIRTGDLGSEWQTAVPIVERSGDSITQRLRNLTPYSGYVQDAEDQAAIHRGRWDTTSQIMRDLQPLADAEAERAAARIARIMEGR